MLVQSSSFNYTYSSFPLESLGLFLVLAFQCLHGVSKDSMWNDCNKFENKTFSNLE